MAIVRFTRNTQRILTDWTRKGGMSCRIRRFMKSLGFVELSAFQWQHPQLFQNFALSVESVNARTSDELCHDLREAWRWSVWDHLTQRSTRRDVALIRHLQFPSQRLKVVQKECSKPVTAHLPAIVTGAFVSPLRYFRMAVSSVPFVNRLWDQPTTVSGIAPCLTLTENNLLMSLRQLLVGHLVKTLRRSGTWPRWDAKSWSTATVPGTLIGFISLAGDCPLLRDSGGVGACRSTRWCLVCVGPRLGPFSKGLEFGWWRSSSLP